MTTNRVNLSAIQGELIVDISLDIGDAGIKFESGAWVAIYNVFDISGMGSLSTEDLVGRRVIKVNELSMSIEIVLEGGVLITIDMKDDAYNSPEAIQLFVPGNPIIIWN